MTATLKAILSDLNEPQRRAVTHRDGPLLVLAGPGSGKTRVITRRAAHLVHLGVDPRNILAITFTNKATDEMKRRIEALGVGRGMWVYTFHALGARLLREFGHLLKLRPDFSIYDVADQGRVLRDAFEECRIGPDALKTEEAQYVISDAKNRLRTAADYAEGGGDFRERMLARVYTAYERMLRERNAVDFDDLLMLPALLLRDTPQITEHLNGRFRYLLIDEYQDTNAAQYLIARFLSRHHRNLCVTGDPDQSIYAWRGADINNILDFERDYRDATVVRLEQNYRSTSSILRVASQVIAFNKRRKPKELWTEGEEGEPPLVWEFDEGRDEARHVAETISKLRAQGRAYDDFAIFYRTNSLSRVLEEALRERGIPYRVARGVEFYNRAEIKDTLGYLRVLANPLDEVALLRIINTPARGIGQTTVERLRRAAAERGVSLLEILRDAHAVAGVKPAAAKRIREFVELLDDLAAQADGPVAPLMTSVLKLSGLEKALRSELDDASEDRLANVEELISDATRYDEETEQPALQEYLQRVSLVSDQDKVDQSAGAVLLMTLHAAKGLEFPVVFIVGLEQGLLPHERSLREGDVEEERRLFFVGLTRAERLLVLSRARVRRVRGSLMPRAASEFLKELPEEGVLRERFSLFPDATPRWPQSEADVFSEERPAHELPWPRQRRRGLRQGDSEPTFSLDDPASYVPPPPPKDSPYAGWQAGMLVEHDAYGVGTLIWIHPTPGQTRAAIRFAGVGQKTFILDRAPVRKLQK